MGYTHYWYTKTRLPATRKSAYLKEAKLLVKHGVDAGILFGPDGQGDAVVTGEIRLNGDGREGHDHESFIFPTDRDFDFCKTAYKPYDKYVCALLILARDHFSEAALPISSDGGYDDWGEGRALYRIVYGREPKSVLEN